MKKKFLMGSVIVSCILLMSGNLYAADATADATGASAYVWRGITFNDGVVLQPSLDVTKGGFGINIWGNHDIDDYDESLDGGQFSEIDLTISYAYSIQSIDLSAGYIEYLFPNAAAPAGREIYVTCGVSPVKGLSLGAAIYYEVDTVNDLYINVSAAYAYEFTDALSAEIGLGAGYIGEDYSVGGESGLNDMSLSLSGSYAISEDISIAAGLCYVDTLDEDVLPEEAVDVNVFGTLSVSVTF